MSLGMRLFSLECTYQLCTQIWDSTFSSGRRVQTPSLKDAVGIYKICIYTIHIHGISFKRIASKLHF